MGLTRLAAAAVADLTAPTPPAQGPPEPVGTTSVSLTYTHSGAPSGTTYTLSVTNIADGTAITPSSGSGLGPYVIPTSDGLTAVHRMVASQGGQTARSDVGVIVVEEAATPAAGWTAALDLDLTGLTTATLTDGVVNTVTRASGGATVASVWASSASNAGTVTAGAAGLRCDGASGTGSVNALIDLEAAAGLALPDDAMNGLAVTFHLTNLTDWTGTGTAWRVGLSADQARFSTGTSNTVQGLLSTTQQQRRIATNESFTNWGSAEATPSGAWCVTLLIQGGSVLWAFYGTTTPSDADLTALTGAVLLSSTVTADVTDAPAGTRYGASLFGGIMAQLQAGFTLTRVVVKTRNV
jgi:hypothetical protein